MASIAIFFSSASNAAVETALWMSSTATLKPYQLKVAHKAITPIQGAQSSHYTLIEKSNLNSHDQEHIRYQIKFDDIPVWNREVILHQNRNQARLTGTMVSKIENDLPDAASLLSENDVVESILGQTHTPIKAKQVEHVIYIDQSHKAHHAYLVSFFTVNDDRTPQYPHYMIDALTGHVFEQWDEVKSDVGEGVGGNNITLPYRGGMFQYGTTLPNLPSLGQFPVDRWAFWCYLQTPVITLFDMGEFYIPYYQRESLFPLSIEEEKNNKLSSPYSTCMPWGRYYNDNDNGHAPTNGAVSPNNDVMYFINETMNLYYQHGITQPLGDDLPIRAITHIGDYENAFYISSIYKKKNHELYSHQQIIIGDGGSRFSALTQSVIPHEISHGFTNTHSNLIYKGESGAIDESFSDMAAIALMDMIRSKYPFYWDGEDWSIGKEISKNGEPLRYLDYPAKDNHSIEHTKDYTPSVDVHYGSGIFNRAFYILATQPGWSIQQAFDIMIQANKNYWESNTTFNAAACGVIQATKDQQLDITAVQYAFNEVGVVCDQMNNVNS